MKTVFKLFAGGLVIFSATEVLSGWSSYDQLIAAVQSCVLPAGTSLVQITDGCVCLAVQAESLPALKNMWKLYQDEWVNVTIEEEACLELMNGAQGIVCCTVVFLLLSPALLSQLKRF